MSRTISDLQSNCFSF